MLEFFSPDGLLAARLPGFEYRPQQGQMAELVMQTLQSGGITMIEAGTGTGKSLAYLLPAVRFALETGERVVVSTNTINLQEQLIQKDIPWIRTAIAPELKAVLVKGWQNYLCLYRFQDLQQESLDLWEDEDPVQLAALRRWVAEGPEEGSRNELPFVPSAALWSSVAAESDTCSRQACPFYEQCYLFRSRRQMEDAHLLVVNHHLLFADVALRRTLGWQSEAVLPPYQYVIIDEAHHIEDVATEHLGVRLSELSLRHLFGRISRSARSDVQAGFVARILTRVQADHPEAPAISGLIDGNLQPSAAQCHELGNHFFAVLRDHLTHQELHDDKTAWRVVVDEGWRATVQPVAIQLAEGLRELGAILKRLGGLLRDGGDAWGAEAHESEALAARAARAAESVEWLASADDTDYVFWIERQFLRRRGETISLCGAPLEVGPLLVEWMSEALRATVMCSATLTVDGSFDYVAGRLGWHIGDPAAHDEKCAAPVRVRTAMIESPFDYGGQSALFVPRDIVEPQHEAFTDQLIRSLVDVLVAAGGRAFVLFTSYSQLRESAEALRDHLYAHGLPLWVQGEAARGILLQGFLENPGSVLFGTDSFWEGVDVQGEALSLVVIVKLPFEVPTHPIAQARTERISEHGGNPFYDYSLPRAALKLKQGFGRLIRSSTDRGAVLIYDSRLLSRRYGQVFLRSLPYVPVQTPALSELAAHVRVIVNPKGP